MGTQQVTGEQFATLIKQMDEKMTVMQNTITQLQDENAQLQAQMMAGSPASDPATTDSLAATLNRLYGTEKKAKIPKPHDYDGDRQKLPTFCREAESYIIDQGLSRDDDVEKAINIIAGYMTGNAATWYTIAYATKARDQKIWTSREDFWTDMKVRFGEANPTFAARTRMSRLKQGSKSVQLYSSIFNELAIQTGFNDEALVHEYFKGLNTDILQGIFRRGDTISSTLEKAIDAATREESAKYMIASFLGGGEKTGPSQASKKPRQPTRRHFQPVKSWKQ